MTSRRHIRLQTLTCIVSCHQRTSGYEDGEKYLVIEPSIKCTDSAYEHLLWLVILLCVIVTVGFPSAYFLLLYSQRDGINPMVLGKFNKLGEVRIV